jgi:hypothetical protein
MPQKMTGNDTCVGYHKRPGHEMNEDCEKLGCKAELILTPAEKRVVDFLWDLLPRDRTCPSGDRVDLPGGTKTKVGMVRTMERVMKPSFAELLAERFPWLKNDQEANGADTVDDLQALYKEWRDKTEVR